MIWNMNILQNNFDDMLIQEKTSFVMIDQFSAWSWTKTISVGAWAKLEYLVLMKEHVELDLRIESSGEGAEIMVKWLILAKDKSKISVKVHAHLMHNHASADLHLVSMLQDGSVSEIDGWVDLHAWVSKISGHLLEENIVLWENIMIKALPMLDVHSSDVSASHGCRITKLDEKKLFYMRSKGLSKSQAEELMITWYFEQIFAWVAQWDDAIVVKRLENEYLDYLLDT